MLFYAQTHGATVALPLILRAIDPEKSDATSVYGYVGPVSSEGISDQDLDEFSAQLRQWLSTNIVVSVFSRLNPYFSELLWVFLTSAIHSPEATVTVDLTEDAKIQFS